MKKHIKSKVLVVLVVAVILIVGLRLLVQRLTPIASATDTLIYDSNRSGTYEIYKLSASGAVAQLTTDKTYDSWWAKSSPDGSQILFYRTPAGTHDKDYTKTSLWMMNIDGSNIHQILAAGANGWGVQGHSEWSPDGTKLVMFGGSSIFITDSNGLVDGTLAPGLDPVWSSDGTKIIYVACDGSGGISCSVNHYRIFSMNTDGTGQKQLEDLPYRANDPTESPDGATIVWEMNKGLAWDIYAMNAGGSNPHFILHDGNINSVPVWSPSGQLYLHKTKPFAYSGFGVWRMNADGTNLGWVTHNQPGSNEFPDVVR